MEPLERQRIMPQIDGLELAEYSELEEDVSLCTFRAPDGARLTIEDCTDRLTEKIIAKKCKTFLSRRRSAVRAAHKYGLELAGYCRDCRCPDKPTDNYIFRATDGSCIKICSDDVFAYRGESETAAAAKQAREIWELRKIRKSLHKHPQKHAKGHRHPSPKPAQKINGKERG